MIVRIFTAPSDYALDTLYTPDRDEVLIGVDKGAYHAVKSGLTLDVAIGDFDSTSPSETEAVRVNARRFIRHADEKDHTDTRLAFDEALKYDPERIVIYGGLTRRLDHTIGNLMLLRDERVSIRDDNTIVFAVSPGEHTLHNPYTYVSLFALDDVKGLTLSGFKYPLENYDLHRYDGRCISNEGSGRVAFIAGRLLVIMSKED